MYYGNRLYYGNRTVARACHKKLIPIPDHNNLPEEYQLTLSGREARARDPANVALHDRLLLFNQNGLMVFASDLDLRRTWLNGTWRVEIWNHSNNQWTDGRLGPRTTNHAEGWHNRINHDFGHPHPALNSFLNWLQESSHVTNIRMQQLLNGNEQPRRRNPRYQVVDRRLLDAKNQFERQHALVIGGFNQDVLQDIQIFMRQLTSTPRSTAWRSMTSHRAVPRHALVSMSRTTGATRAARSRTVPRGKLFVRNTRSFVNASLMR
uniref:Uncharacterized protein n=1 Tax=Romanomermis culicivorax TaxID=13658 RepID=A0A915JJT0_ROMCU